MGTLENPAVIDSSVLGVFYLVWIDSLIVEKAPA
jgi:hypothetical protein